MNDSLYIERYFGDVSELAKKISRREITRVINILFRAWKNGQWVFVMGNGGSASNATHFAADLVKTIVGEIGQKGIKAIALADNIPLASALTNDWGWENLYTGQLATLWIPGSVAIGISVHGGSGKDKAGAWSQNLLKALQFAKDNDGTTIGFAGFDGGAMKKMVDACVVIPAESTPLVESFHSVVQHLIVFRLKELISQSKNKKR
mgnify:CR=1 FL=1